jgi:hypothetical protein
MDRKRPHLVPPPRAGEDEGGGNLETSRISPYVVSFAIVYPAASAKNLVSSIGSTVLFSAE